MAGENCQQILTWRCHPAREQAGRALLGAAIIVAIAVVALVEFGPWWAVGSLAILVLSLNRFFFASEFTIDGQGIRAKHLLRSKTMHWRDVRRFVHDGNGGFLSTRSRSSWIDGHRGMHVLFGAQRDQVIECIHNCMKAQSIEAGGDASAPANQAPATGAAA